MDLNFTLTPGWVDFLLVFGIANIATGLIGTAMRQMGRGGMRSKRAALFIMAGALFIVCSFRYKAEIKETPAQSGPAAIVAPNAAK